MILVKVSVVAGGISKISKICSAHVNSKGTLKKSSNHVLNTHFLNTQRYFIIKSYKEDDNILMFIGYPCSCHEKKHTFFNGKTM